MFSGEYPATMDDKGRISVPTRLREELGYNAVMWRGVDGQVMVYRKEVWETLLEKLSQQQTRRQVRKAKFVIFSGIEVDIDRQGRVVIPSSLRKHAELGSSLMVLGNDDHIEIWNETRWEMLHRDVMSEAGDIADVLADLGVKL